MAANSQVGSAQLGYIDLETTNQIPTEETQATSAPVIVEDSPGPKLSARKCSLRPPPALLPIQKPMKPQKLTRSFSKTTPTGVEIPRGYRWCNYCEKVLNRKHNHRYEFFPCPHCDREYTRKDNLKVHIRSCHKLPA